MKKPFSQFATDLKAAEKKMKSELNLAVPKAVATLTLSTFKESFTLQKFNDGYSMPWKEVKRRQFGNKWYGFKLGANQRIPKGGRGYLLNFKGDKTNFSKARTTNNILFGSGSSNLRDSLFIAKAYRGLIIIATDSDYAKIHNEGGIASAFGRKMPKRQFMGHSILLNAKALKLVDKMVDRIFNENN